MVCLLRETVVTREAGRPVKHGGVELQVREGDMFAIIRKVTNVYLIELKVTTLRLVAWMDNSGRTELTHQGLMERLEGSI